MASISPYLTFEGGKCRQAFEFYEKVFGVPFVNAGTFGEMPPEYTVDDKYKDYIMHATLSLGDSILMGSDTAPGFGPPVIQGNNYSVSVHIDSEDEARRIFEAMAEGGEVSMPMAPTFWGSLFGMLKDKFGINWMISYAFPEEEQS